MLSVVTDEAAFAIVSNVVVDKTGTSATVVVTTTSHRVVLSGLPPRATYSYRARATRESGEIVTSPALHLPHRKPMTRALDPPTSLL